MEQDEKDHQTLMNQAYKKWENNDIRREEFLLLLSPVEKLAVILGNFNYQVCNGGFSQWNYNDYSCDAGYLFEMFNKFVNNGHTQFKFYTTLLQEFMEMEGDEQKSLGETFCYECNGSGKSSNSDENEWIDCEECNGNGFIKEESIDNNVAYLYNLDEQYYQRDQDVIMKDFQFMIDNFDKLPNVYITPIFIKPKCNLVGIDGNVFNLVGVVKSCLDRAGYKDKAKEMYERATTKCSSYDDILVMFHDYVDIQ